MKCFVRFAVNNAHLRAINHHELTFTFVFKIGTLVSRVSFHERDLSL